MKLDGQLEGAQLENLSNASPTPTPSGRMYLDTSVTPNLVKAYTGAAWETVQMKSWSYKSKTANYTVLAADSYFLADDSGGSFTFTLPAVASVDGQLFYFMKTTSSKNVVTLDGNGAETIDGLTTYELREQHEWVCIQAQSTVWKVISYGRDFLSAQSYTTTCSPATGYSLHDATSAAYTATLPTAASMVGRTMYHKKTDATFNAVTLDGNGAETIDGAANLVLRSLGEWAKIYSNGTSWVLLEWGYYEGMTAFTPTGAWVTNATWTGFWWRTGNRINLEYLCTLAGATSSATFTGNYPTGIVADTAKMTKALALKQPLPGSGLFYDDSTTTGYTAYAEFSTNAAFTGRIGAVGAPITQVALTDTVPVTAANADFALFTILSLPVVGWRG